MKSVLFVPLSKPLEKRRRKSRLSPYYADCNEMTKHMTEASMEMFTEILNACDGVESMTKRKDGKFGLVSKVQWAVFQKPKMAVLRAAIEAYKSNLALMLGTLNTAEKVARRASQVATPETTAEDENDRSLLQSLELEHRTSLIELEEAERQLKERQSKALHDPTPGPGLDLNLDPATTAEVDVGSGTDSEESRALDSLPDSFVDALRVEIESIRSSISSESPIDPDLLQEQVIRHSQRVSVLIADDQSRISQRWSTVSSLQPIRLLSYLPNPWDISRPTLTSTRFPVKPSYPIETTTYEASNPDSPKS